MEERKKNLCAMIPESLHKKVREVDRYRHTSGG